MIHSGITLELLGVVGAIATLEVLILCGSRHLTASSASSALFGPMPSDCVAASSPKSSGGPAAVRGRARGPGQIVGVIDASPAAVHRHPQSQPDVYPRTLASLQWTAIDGERVLEVGSYAERPEGLFGRWQVHVRVFPVPGESAKSRIVGHQEFILNCSQLE